MRRGEHSVLIAISVSLVLHGTCLYVMSQGAIRDYAKLAYQPAVRSDAPVSHGPILVDIPRKAPLAEKIAVKPPAPPAPPARPVPSPVPPKPLPPVAQPAPAAPRPSAPPAAAAGHPQPIKPLELAPIEGIPPLVREPDDFGELSGTDEATAMKSISGEKPMQARKAEQDQPYISRDPVGHASSMSPPSPKDIGSIDKPGKTGPSGDQGTGGDPLKAQSHEAQPQEAKPRDAQPQPIQPPPAALPKPLPAQEKPTPLPPAKPIEVAMLTPPSIPADGAETASLPGPHLRERSPARDISPAPATSSPPEAQPENTSPSMPVPQPQSAAPPTPSPARPASVSHRAGSPEAGTSSASGSDPAPATDSEMDPFAVVGTAEFRPGRVTARFGRKVKTVRPRLGLAAQRDLYSLPSPSVILRVRADEAGQVREVKIVKSSGSTEVDLRCYEAIYEWWFEPPKDKLGNPQASEMLWTLNWR
jgi:TonB family protein